MNLVLVADRACIDPAMGSDLRLWNLMGRGDADHIHLSESEQAPPSDPRGAYAWRSISRIAVAPGTFSIRRWDIRAGGYVARHRETIAALREKLAALRGMAGAIGVVAHGHRSGLLVARALEGPFVLESGDSMAVYFNRRAGALGFSDPVRMVNSMVWAQVYDSIERELGGLAALWVLPAEADRRGIARHSPKAALMVLPNGTHYLERDPVPPCAEPSIGFYGGMAWEPNRSAALFLARQVFPLVKRAVPGAVLHIGGGPLEPELESLGRTDMAIRMHGPISDIPGFLSRCAVFVAPMLQGSGFKNKLIEAMALGMAIVTNPLGAEALGRQARAAVVVAQGTAQIAQATSMLLLDPERRAWHARAARAAAEADYRWGELSARFREASLGVLGGGRK